MEEERNVEEEMEETAEGEETFIPAEEEEEGDLEMKSLEVEDTPQTFEEYDEEEGEDLEVTYIKPPDTSISEEWGDPTDNPNLQYYDEYNEYDGEESSSASAAPYFVPSTHISQMFFESPGTARPFAELILQTLEEDLAAYAEKKGIDFDNPTGMKGKRFRRPSESVLSVDSIVSLPLEGEPSRLKLIYEKGDAEFKDSRIPHLAKGKGVNEAVEANIRRKKIQRISKSLGKKEIEVQTKEMTFLTEAKAQLVYLEMYRRSDDWKPPATPTRQASLDEVVAEAEKADPQVDRSRKGPQIINFTNRKKILQPLRDDYFKDESFWTGSRFRGEYKNRQFEKGHYDHPTGVTFKSEWKDGHFHTKNHLGVLVYPRGDKFEGEWRNGRYFSGIITFADGLVYQNRNWHYCEAPDRRLKVEKKYGLKPAGNTIYNDQYPQTNVNPGCYDVGDGIYDPKTGEIRGYDGFFLRNPSATEHNWIVQNCRKTPEKGDEYIPNFNIDRVPGSYMEQVQRFSIAKRKYH